MLLFRPFAHYCSLLLSFVAFSSFCSLLNGKDTFSSEVLRDRFGIPSGFLRDCFGKSRSGPGRISKQSRSKPGDYLCLAEKTLQVSRIIQNRLYRFLVMVAIAFPGRYPNTTCLPGRVSKCVLNMCLGKGELGINGLKGIPA
jgi:hypothetical protein